jgi:hypothetical protein
VVNDEQRRPGGLSDQPVIEGASPEHVESKLERSSPGRLLLAGVLALITLSPAAIAVVSIYHIFSYPDQEQIGSVTTVQRYFLPLRS